MYAHASSRLTLDGAFVEPLGEDVGFDDGLAVVPGVGVATGVLFVFAVSFSAVCTCERTFGQLGLAVAKPSLPFWKTMLRIVVPWTRSANVTSAGNALCGMSVMMVCFAADATFSYRSSNVDGWACWATALITHRWRSMRL